MADEPPGGADRRGATNGEAAQEAPQLGIGAHYVKDLSFENPQGPRVLAELAEAPSVEIEANANARSLTEGLYEVTLFLRGETKAAGSSIFIVELTYGAIVVLEGLSEEQARPYLLVETPRHLFPFAHAVVANVTRDGGFPPLLIDPIDFAALYAERHAEPAAATSQ